MISRGLLFLLVLISATAVARDAAAPPRLALEHGEKLRFRVSWAIVPGAGEIKISAQHDMSSGSPQLVVTSSTATRAFAKILLPFAAESKAVFDLKTGRMLSMHESSLLRARRGEHMVTFDYQKREASYVPRLPPDKKPQTLPMPQGDPTDLIMALLHTRTWDLKPGEKRDSLVLWDDDFYELTIHAMRFEQVKTPLGTFNTLMLEPRMDKTPPKGMFRKGSTVRVWIAQEAPKLPVKFEVEFKIGTGTAVLEAYEPPKSGAAAISGAGTPPRNAKNSGS
jgi:hypothetical protein